MVNRQLQEDKKSLQVRIPKGKKKRKLIAIKKNLKKRAGSNKKKRGEICFVQLGPTQAEWGQPSLPHPPSPANVQPSTYSSTKAHVTPALALLIQPRTVQRTRPTLLSIRTRPLAQL